MKHQLTILLCLFSILSYAQEAIVTDRPDQTESSQTVGHGVLQIETGLLFERVTLDAPNDPVNKLDSYGTTLLRLGIGDQFELRAITAYQREEFFNAPEATAGLAPLSLGAKMKLWKEDRWIPDAAFIMHLTFPGIGEEAFRPEYIAPDFRFSFAHTLSERVSLGYNLGLEWDGVSPASTGIYTLALGSGIILDLSAYVELYGFLPEGGDGAHYFNGGFTYLLFPDVQFDLSGGFGLSDSVSNYHFISLGVSVRIPHLF